MQPYLATLFRRIVLVGQGVADRLGDWLNYGERSYGEMYTQAVGATGYENKTLRNAKWVSSVYELSCRHDNLSFTHHQEAASLPPSQRADILTRAEREGWPAARLRREVRLASAKAIERYVASKEHKDEARRAARVLETAVGEALGPAPGHGPGRGKTSLVSNVLSSDDAHRFRLMAAHRELWWPRLAERGLSRKQVLTMIAEGKYRAGAGYENLMRAELSATEMAEHRRRSAPPIRGRRLCPGRDDPPVWRGARLPWACRGCLCGTCHRQPCCPYSSRIYGRPWSCCIASIGRVLLIAGAALLFASLCGTRSRFSTLAPVASWQSWRPRRHVRAASAHTAWREPSPEFWRSQFCV